MTEQADKAAVEREVIERLQRNISVTANNKGSYHIDVGDGLIVFDIHNSIVEFVEGIKT